MAIHPRVSVSSLSSWGQPLADDIAMWNELGIDLVALLLQKVEPVGAEAARALVCDA